MANFIIPFTTPGNYTYDANKMEVASGLGRLKNVGIKGIDFDGIDDLVLVPDTNNFDYLAGDWAISCLVRPGAMVNMAVAGKDDLGTQRQFQMAILAPGTAQIAYWKSGAVLVAQATLASHFSSGVLAHVIFQKRTSAFQIYVNGVFVALGGLIGIHGAMASTSAPLAIGAGSPTGAVPFKGWISRLSLHSQSFSGAEAATLYSEIMRLEPNEITLPNLSAFYPMDDGADATSADGETVADPYSGNNNNGTGDDGANNTGLQWDLDLAVTRYTSSKPSIYKTAGDTGFVQAFTNFVVSYGIIEGTATFQLSEDGITWKYWNGSAWVTAGATDYNSEATVNTNIATFPVTSQKLYVKHFSISNGAQRVEVNEIQVGFSENQLPVVDAGTNKNTFDGLYFAPFSDCSFSDPDGTVDKAYYKIDGEVDIWTEIPQGGYGTLLEAVQAFEYQFSNTGAITARLQVEDNEGSLADDSLIVTVSKYTVTFNIKDAYTAHIEHVLFDPGNGDTPEYKDSPFTWDYNFGEFTAIVSKVGKISGEILIDIVGPGQFYTLIMERIITEGDIPVLADAVALKAFATNDVEVLVEDDEEILVEIDDEEYIVETEEDDIIKVEILDDDINIEIENDDPIDILLD